MTLRRGLPATTCLAIPLAFGQPAAAQPVTGLYLGAGAGVNLWQDQSDRGVRIHDEDIGLAGVVSIGWGFGNGVRAEVEGNFRTHDMNLVVASGAGRIGNSGYLRQYGAMANALFDFDMSSFGIAPNVAMPYAGLGAGYLWREFSDVRLATAGSSFRIDDTAGAFAYQGILGMSFGLGGMVPGLAITSEYRYLGALEASNGITRTSGPAVAAVPGSVKLGTANHSVMLGLRYAFNPPRPVVAAPAAPPPGPDVARTYLVFFDFDRADLTDRARQIIGEAASAAPRVQSTRIELAGHADRSGTPQYNQRLSQRRADAVAAELVRRGVARDAITVTAFGESRPLVATADGVREPQNRRVEIILR